MTVCYQCIRFIFCKMSKMGKNIWRSHKNTVRGVICVSIQRPSTLRAHSKFILKCLKREVCKNIFWLPSLGWIPNVASLCHSELYICIDSLTLVLGMLCQFLDVLELLPREHSRQISTPLRTDREQWRLDALWQLNNVTHLCLSLASRSNTSTLQYYLILSMQSSRRKHDHNSLLRCRTIGRQEVSDFYTVTSMYS